MSVRYVTVDNLKDPLLDLNPLQLHGMAESTGLAEHHR